MPMAVSICGATLCMVFAQMSKKSALLDDKGTMIGSFIVCDYPSREQLEIQWLDNEPYITGKVWQEVEIHPVFISPRACSKREPK